MVIAFKIDVSLSVMEKIKTLPITFKNKNIPVHREQSMQCFLRPANKKINLTSRDLGTSRTKQTMSDDFSGEEFKNTSSLSCGEFGVSIIFQYSDHTCLVFTFMLCPSFCRSESSEWVNRTPGAFPPRSFSWSTAAEDPVGSLRSVWLALGLSILFVAGLLRQARGHSGCLHHCFETALPLLDVLLRVEDDDVDLGDVEHAQGYGGAQAHGHGQGRGLDEHLERVWPHLRQKSITW